MRRGRLRQLSKQITRDVINIIKRPYKHKSNRSLPGRNRLYLWSPDIKRDPCQEESSAGFMVKLKLLDDESMTYSIDAQAGDEDGESYIWLTISLPRGEVGVREHIYHELLGVVRHELEHLSGAGPLAMMGPDQRKLYGERLPQSGKILHDLNRRRRLFGHSAHPHELWGIEELERSDAASGGDTLSYMTSYDELGPFSVGFYTQARSARIPYEQVVKQYIDYFHDSGQLTDAGAAQALEWFMTWGNDKFPKIR